MPFRMVRLGELSAADIARWRTLADEAIEPNPNADPRFLMPSLGKGIGAEALSLAIVEEDRRFRLAMPFSLADELSGARIRHVSTHGSFMHEHASKNHPLVAPDDPAGDLAVLVAGLRTERLPDLLNLTIVPVDGPLYAAIHGSSGALRVLERGRDARAYARRDDLGVSADSEWYSDADDILSFPTPHLSTRTGRQLRKFGAQIEKAANGRLRLSRGDADVALIDEFLDLQAAGWKGDESRGGPQFRLRGLEPWFREVVGAFARDGDLRAIRMTAGEETVYLAVWFAAGGRAFGFHDVFDERFKSWSPGAVGRLALLGHVLSEPGSTFDPGMEPHYRQASSVFPSRREYADLLIAGASPRARAAVSLFPLLKRMRRLLRSS